LRGRLEEIRASGAELVIVGNGSASFARAFREDFHLEGVTLLVDPELRAYRAAGLRRGRVEALSPRLPGQALRALRGGFRQGAVQGDPWQLGGAFVIRPDGSLAFQHHAREPATTRTSTRSSTPCVRGRPTSRRASRPARSSASPGTPPRRSSIRRSRAPSVARASRRGRSPSIPAISTSTSPGASAW
jgi:hypothetical protein